MKKRELVFALIGSAILSCTRRFENKHGTSDSAGPNANDETNSNEDSMCLETALSVQLDEYPELRLSNGNALISFPDSFVHVLIVCVETDEQWVAVWKICTHGNCDVEWDLDEQWVVCPCHNSIFDFDGSVLQGPATRGLKSYNVCKEGDTLFLTEV